MPEDPALSARVVLLMQRLEPLAGDMGIDLGGGQVGMPQQHLHNPKIGSVVQKMGHDTLGVC